MKKTSLKDIGWRIMKVRTKLGTKQNEMAEKIGVLKAAMFRVEHGNPSAENLLATLQLLAEMGVDLNRLVATDFSIEDPGLLKRQDSREEIINRLQPVISSLQDTVWVLRNNKD